MTLVEYSAKIFQILRQSDESNFSAKDLSERIHLPVARVSDILNVLSSMYIIDREGRNFHYRYQDLSSEIVYYLNNELREGRNETIYELTRTVCYRIFKHEKVEENRRTYDVLHILEGVNVIYKVNNKWEFNIQPWDSITCNLIERDSKIEEDFFSIMSFSD